MSTVTVRIGQETRDLEAANESWINDQLNRRRRARAGVIPASEAERICRSYAIVESDDAIITVGHRFRRIPRDR